MAKHEMTGRVFGMLTVISEAGLDKWGQYRWQCRCACGAIHFAAGGKLRRGEVTSCGCDTARRLREANVKHGDASGGQLTPEYRAWSNMIDRCERPGNKQYKDWGGRGIAVCDRWRRSFADFLEDVGRRPSAQHTLGRIDNDRNYEPGNVRWETRAEQNKNKRSTISVTFDGHTLCLREWSRVVSIPYQTLYQRHRSGWPVEQMLTEPVQQGRALRDRTKKGDT